jgi:hypothetical protein
MSQPPPYATALTHDETAEILDHLHTFYGHRQTLVMHQSILDMLPQLRALERDGLVEITTLVLEKRWVSTPGGALWRLLHRSGRRWSLAQLLVHPDLAWAPADRLVADIERLTKWGLLRAWCRQYPSYMVSENDLVVMPEPVWIEKTDNLPASRLGTLRLEPHKPS